MKPIQMWELHWQYSYEYTFMPTCETHLFMQLLLPCQYSGDLLGSVRICKTVECLSHLFCLYTETTHRPPPQWLLLTPSKQTDGLGQTESSKSCITTQRRVCHSQSHRRVVSCYRLYIFFIILVPVLGFIFSFIIHLFLSYNLFYIRTKCPL